MSATCDFEETAGFSVSSDIKRSGNWAQSAAGAGQITDAQSAGGGQCLEIPASETNRAVVTSFPKPEDGIVFVDFSIRPAADSATEPQITFDGNGAFLGFVKNGEVGTVVAVSDSATGTSVSSSYKFNIDDQNLAADWIRVTIRENISAKTWDLYLDGALKLIDQPLGPNAEAKSRTAAPLTFYPSSAGVTYVDDVSVSEANPLFADADKDGIPDAMEKLQGMNPKVDDRQLRNARGITNIDEFAAKSSQSPEVLGKSIIYVDNNTGDDRNTGEMSYSQAKRGPKGTIKAALDETNADVTIAVFESAKPYQMPRMGKTDRSATFMPVGNITIEN